MTTVNAMQPDATIRKQGSLPLLSAMTAPKELPSELVMQCRSHLDAIRLCIHASNMSNQAVCDELGIDKGHWSRILQGRAHFPSSKEPDLMRLCGNVAPLQYLAGAMGYQITKDDSRAREEALEAELAAIRAKRAA